MDHREARKYMERAIDIMHGSVAESRADDKISPKVGAVLVDPAKDVRSKGHEVHAYRGELREGDHAEFALLERKCRDRRLDGCVLFATLEPCAPKSRNFPKLGCAERIVLARIKEVWVGIEDPDPTVDRKGIKYLQDAGVQVNMFDRDLQEQIRQENSKFIEQALERAAVEEQKTHDVVLSPLESAVAHTMLDDLDESALRRYSDRLGGSEDVRSQPFLRRLVRQNLLRNDGKNSVPTGFGLLLFGREPRTSMAQAGLLATIHYPEGTEETKDFDGPQVIVPDDVLKWLRDKWRNVIDRTDAERRPKNESVYELVREGVVNALVHRDYSITGAKCQIAVFTDRIEIRSPGRPVPPITLEQLQELSAPMLSRNPVLHFVFGKMGMAEERGLGLKSMRQRAQEENLPIPRYRWEDPYLVLTIQTTLDAPGASLPPDKRAQLVGGELKGWNWFCTKGQTTSGEYAKALAVDERTARRHLGHFVKLGLAVSTGSGPSTEYQLR